VYNFFGLFSYFFALFR